MIYIAHRGNISGRNKEKENHPDYIMEAIKLGYHAEIDVWFKDNKYFLGHNNPEYKIDKKFLMNSKLWCHAKNIETISALSEYKHSIHYFFHQTDDCVLTSQGWIWTYPGKDILCKNAVVVCPEKFIDYNIEKAGGICSDFITKYKK
jgi:hypothetical protein